MSDMSSTSGYVGVKYVQEFRSICFEMSSASGYMSAKYVQQFGSRLLACHVTHIVCHDVSISIMSISSVPCRVSILLVSMSVPCRDHPENNSQRISHIVSLPVRTLLTFLAGCISSLMMWESGCTFFGVSLCYVIFALFPGARRSPLPPGQTFISQFDHPPSHQGIKHAARFPCCNVSSPYYGFV